MTKKSTNGTVHNGQHPVWPTQHSRPDRPSHNDTQKQEKQNMRIRIFVGVALVLLAFILVPFTERRAIDPFNKYLIIEPIIGLFLYWPLSRVLVRSFRSQVWGQIFSLLPFFVLIAARFLGTQRDPEFGIQTNFSFGVIIFVGVCSFAAYLLFRKPPPEEKSS